MPHRQTMATRPPGRTRTVGRRWRQAWTGLLLLAALGTAQAAKPAPTPAPYSYFVTGNAQAMVTASAPTSPSLVLMGGGPDVDEAFRWMITRAGIQPGTGGRFVVIRATGTEAYDPYIFYSDANLSTSSTIADQWVGGASLGLSSVETLVIPSVAAANDAYVNTVVGRANAVFIAGGDQSDYIKYWKNTTLHTTLNRLLAANVPIGGTSAGLAVLGQFDFAALQGAVTSKQALGDPYNKYMTLDPNPLSLSGGFLTPAALNNTILDSHLDSRDRMGRMMTFVARLVAPQTGGGCPGGILNAGSSSTYGARAIGLGVETALLVQRNGANQYTAKRVTNVSTTSESAAYFVRPMQVPGVCASRKPLTMPLVEVRKLADDTEFNLSDWSGKPAYFIDISNGTLSASPY